MQVMSKFKKTHLANLIFLALCGGLLFFLLNAPPESTPRLPRDSDHLRFYSLSKKEAEKKCNACHGQDGIKELAKKHPATYRCLLCHKQER